MTLRELFKQISIKEWLIIGFTWLAIFFISLIPLFFAIPGVRQGYVISGLHNVYKIDVNVYLSYLHQVMDGKYLLDTLFTTENAMPMFRPFWLVLGLIGKWFNFSPLVTYYLGRFLFLAFLLLIIFAFIKYFFSDDKKAKFIFLIISFSTGIGYLIAPLIAVLDKNFQYALNWPIDMWVPEGFIFLSSIHSPHIIYTWALLILIYFIWIKIVDNNYHANKLIAYGVLAGFLGFLLFISHPFHILPVYITILAHYIFIFFTDRKKAKQLFNWLIVFGSLSFIGVFYHLYYLANDFLTADKALQNYTPTPNFLMFLTGYFVFFPLALYQIFKNFRNYKNVNNKWIFLGIWMLVNFILIYSPFPWQRRMIQGLQIPMILLSAQWFFVAWNKVQNTNKKKIFNFKLRTIFVIFFMLLPTSIYNIASNAVNYHQKYWLYYYSKDFYSGLQKLEDITDADSKIFSLAVTGNFIVGVAGRKVFVGHGVETAFYDSKIYAIEYFFQDNKDNDKKYQLLKQYHITHLFYSKYEKNIGKFNPRDKKYLKLIYQNPEVEIYKVL